MSQPTRVLLVNAPWATVKLPSLQLALLGAALREQGIDCDEAYLNVDLAARIGCELYESVAEQPYLLGELIAAPFVFPDRGGAAALAAVEDYLAWRHGFVALRVLEQIRAGHDRIQESFRGMLEEFLARDFGSYFLVGFTSTFEQNLPALALARGVKERAPHIQVVLGGANCEGEMGEELHRAFPQVDHVVQGEGEAALPELAMAVRGGGPVSRIAGVLSREDGRPVAGPARPGRANLDTLPTPEFHGYFSALDRSGLGIEPRLQLEMSRGCWWGAKHLCKFCGLNQVAQAYRSKSPRRVLAEVKLLMERHGVTGFNVVDNILDARYFASLLPSLAALHDRWDTDFFAELKSNVRREQVELLRDAGFIAIQPGIESFSDRVLHLMDKGVTGLRNIQAIRWFTEQKIVCKYGLLLDTPGECEQDYAAMIDLVGKIGHLQAPSYVIPIMLHRFSPYFEQRNAYQLAEVRPVPQYELAYGAGVEVSRLAFYFDYDRARGAGVDRLQRQLQAVCESWRKDYRHGLLTYERGPGFLRIRDRRRGVDREHCLRGWEARLYLECDRIRDARSLVEEYGPRAASRLRQWVDEGLMLQDKEDHVLSLAVAPEPAGRRARGSAPSVRGAALPGRVRARQHD